MEKFVLAIDQGTTRSKAALFDNRGRLRGFGSAGLAKLYPRPGWVEQKPARMWSSVILSTRTAMLTAHCRPEQIVGVGLDNQGETVVAWDKRTGRPVYNAIVWQCRRTVQACERLKTRKALAREIHRKTGLVIDPYFSATKLRWLVDNARNAKKLLRAGRLLLGTSDTWLIWKLTGGRHLITDLSTAARTMLLNIHKMKWDENLLSVFNLSEEDLADLVPNSGELAYTDPHSFLGIGAPISGLIVDQQAALYGHGCFRAGGLKNTYGTGCFTLMNTGRTPKFSRHGLLTTIAWVVRGVRTYALDGGVYTAGSVIDWLVRGLRILNSPAESERLASSIPNNEGVFFVPAFVGLAAPYWDSTAKGTIVGMTDRTSRATITRAALESIAYQVHEILLCMEADSGLRVRELAVDGGPTSNRFLMQFQADISRVRVAVPDFKEVTVKGTALLAGLGVDFWDESLKDLVVSRNRVYKPNMNKSERTRLFADWKRAVTRSRRWNA